MPANKTKGRTASSLLPARGVPCATSPIRSHRIGSDDVRHIPSPPSPQAVEPRLRRQKKSQCVTLSGTLCIANLNLLLALTERCPAKAPLHREPRHTACSACTRTPDPRCFCPNRGQRCCAGKRAGATVHETRCEPRALRLLAGEARNPCCAGAHGNRAGRHSRRACRCVRADARPTGGLSHPPRRNTAVRPLRPRSQRRVVPRSLGLTNRPTLEGLLSILSDECIGTVAGATAQNASGETLELELLLLPLSIRRPIFARAIGVLAPLKFPPWLGASALGPFTIGGRRHVGAAIEKRLLPRFAAPRSRRGFLVYDGGRGPLAVQDEDGPSAA